VARVLGGYTLRGPQGATVAVVPPTAIATDGERVVRRLALPLNGLQPGAYELTLTVEDQLAQRTLSALATFTLEPAAPAPGLD
jgi:hypothetical protein